MTGVYLHVDNRRAAGYLEYACFMWQSSDSPAASCHILPVPEAGFAMAGRHVGLWRARVVDVGVTQRAVRGRLGEPSLRVLVGDVSGARSEVLVPFLRRRAPHGESSTMHCRARSACPGWDAVDVGMVSGEALAARVDRRRQRRMQGGAGALPVPAPPCMRPSCAGALPAQARPR